MCRQLRRCGDGPEDGLAVRYLNVCYTNSEGSACGLDALGAGTDGVDCNPGDSGGPVYHRLNSVDVKISGDVEAGDGSHCYFTTYSQLATYGGLSFETS